MNHYASPHFASTHFAAPHWGSNDTVIIDSGRRPGGGSSNAPTLARRNYILDPPREPYIDSHESDLVAITTLLAVYYEYE